MGLLTLFFYWKQKESYKFLVGINKKIKKTHT